MPAHPHDDQPDERELAALADGSLPPERVAALERLVAESPVLAAAVARQRRAVEAVRGVSVSAPPGLRAQVEQAKRSRRSVRWRRFAVASPALAGAAAAAVVIAASGGGAAAPTVAAAADLGGRAAMQPAPAPVAAQPVLLAARADGVPYPNLLRRYGWHATGARSDRLGGRRATTVFYAKGGRRIGYTIVSGAPLPIPRGTAVRSDAGVRLTAFEARGREAVTWRRLGHTCVLSGGGVEARRLADLASYRGGGAIPF